MCKTHEIPLFSCMCAYVSLNYPACVSMPCFCVVMRSFVSHSLNFVRQHTLSRSRRTSCIPGHPFVFLLQECEVTLRGLSLKVKCTTEFVVELNFIDFNRVS